MVLIRIELFKDKKFQKIELWKSHVDKLGQWLPDQLELVNATDGFLININPRSPPDFEAIYQIFQLFTLSGFERVDDASSPVFRPGTTENEMKLDYEDFMIISTWRAFTSPSTNTLLCLRPARDDATVPVDVRYLPERLHRAIKSSNLQEVVSLLDLGTDPNTKKNEIAAITVAVQNGRADIVDALLLHRATVQFEATDMHNQVIAIAARRGDKEMVKTLSRMGASAHGFLVQDLIEQDASTDLVKLCLDAGAAINGRDKRGRTPLHVAIQRRNIFMVRLFMSSYVIDRHAAGEDGKTPLHLAALVGDEEILDVLLQKGCRQSVSAKDKTGRTPLHLAAQNENEGIVELLLGEGADPAEEDYGGITPWVEARRWGNGRVTRLLEDFEDWYPRFLSDMQRETCSVCLDTIVLGQIKGLVCGHFFHETCLLSLRRRQLRCPICRATIEVASSWAEARRKDFLKQRKKKLTQSIRPL